jgi:hypothetical protein
MLNRVDPARARAARPRGWGGAAVLGLARCASGCVYVPAPVAGVPAGGPWVALPLRGWIAEGGIEAEAIAGCFAADCAPRAGVGVFRARGEDARVIAGLLRDPDRLARLLTQRRAAGAAKRGPRTAFSAAPLAAGDLVGFVLTLSRDDGGRAAHAVVLGAPRGAEIRFAIVVGESREGVENLAREVGMKLR